MAAPTPEPLRLLMPDRTSPVFYMTDNKDGASCYSGGAHKKLKATETQETLTKILKNSTHLDVTVGHTMEERREAAQYVTDVAQSFGIAITTSIVSPRHEFQKTVESSPIPPAAFLPNEGRVRNAVVLALGASTAHIGVIDCNLVTKWHQAFAVEDTIAVVQGISQVLSLLPNRRVIVCGCPTYVGHLPFNRLEMFPPRHTAYVKGWASILLTDFLELAHDPETGLAGPGKPALKILETLQLGMAICV